MLSFNLHPNTECPPLWQQSCSQVLKGVEHKTTYNQGLQIHGYCFTSSKVYGFLLSKHHRPKVVLYRRAKLDSFPLSCENSVCRSSALVFCVPSHKLELYLEIFCFKSSKQISRKTEPIDDQNMKYEEIGAIRDTS